MPTTTHIRRGLFLDRDGTLIVHIPYLHKPEDVVVIPGVPAALARARDAGFRFYLFTNQSGVGRGMFTIDDVHAVNARMLELIGLGSDLFAGVCIAPESPEQPAVYRKPSPRFIEEMCARDGLDRAGSWMIGDAPSDWEAGLAAGIQSAAVGLDHEPTRHRAIREEMKLPAFRDLDAAVTAILTQPRGRGRMPLSG